MAVIKHASKGYVKTSGGGGAPTYTTNKADAKQFKDRGAKIQATKLTTGGHGTHSAE
jgi:hypothetical protein